jgi:hypothetical protein
MEIDMEKEIESHLSPICRLSNNDIRQIPLLINAVIASNSGLPKHFHVTPRELILAIKTLLVVQNETPEKLGITTKGLLLSEVITKFRLDIGPLNQQKALSRIREAVGIRNAIALHAILNVDEQIGVHTEL